MRSSSAVAALAVLQTQAMRRRVTHRRFLPCRLAAVAVVLVLLATAMVVVVVLAEVPEQLARRELVRPRRGTTAGLVQVVVALVAVAVLGALDKPLREVLVVRAAQV